MTDIINEPSHYKGRHGLEAIEVVRKNLDWLIEHTEG